METLHFQAVGEFGGGEIKMWEEATSLLCSRVVLRVPPSFPDIWLLALLSDHYAAWRNSSFLRDSRELGNWVFLFSLWVFMKVRYPGEGLASGLQNNGLLRVPWAGLKQNKSISGLPFSYFPLLSSSWLHGQNFRGEWPCGSLRFLSQSSWRSFRADFISAALPGTRWRW